MTPKTAVFTLDDLAMVLGKEAALRLDWPIGSMSVTLQTDTVDGVVSQIAVTISDPPTPGPAPSR